MSKTTPKPKKGKSRRNSSGWRENIWWIVGGIIVFAIVGFMALQSVNGQTTPTTDAGLIGDVIPVTSRDHVSPNLPPPAYNSNPPAGGAHFPTNLPAKFYQDSDLATLPAYPEGYLVHSLEHGYVIFWYNCKIISADACTSMKKTIQSVMDTYGGTKLIAFPWTTIDVPLAMTSWGRLLKFKTPDQAKMAEFVAHNRYQAPEPDAQ